MKSQLTRSRTAVKSINTAHRVNSADFYTLNCVNSEASTEQLTVVQLLHWLPHSSAAGWTLKYLLAGTLKIVTDVLHNVRNNVACPTDQIQSWATRNSPTYSGETTLAEHPGSSQVQIVSTCLQVLAWFGA